MHRPEARERTYIDSRTGEMFDLVAVPRSSQHIGGAFVMLTQIAVLDVAKRTDLTDGDLRVLLALLGRLNWENWLMLDLTELSSEIGRERANTSRAIRRLVDAGVLHRGPKAGRSWTYRLDPELGWKGHPSARPKAIAEARARWGKAELEGQLTIED
jgi:hypothetical protein